MVMPTVLMERFEMHILSLYHCGGNHCLMCCLIMQTTWMRGSHRIGHRPSTARFGNSIEYGNQSLEIVLYWLKSKVKRFISV